MPALGITGGVGTGKSTVTQSLAAALGAAAFDADRCGHDLLNSDSAVQTAVRAAFGDAVFDANGVPVRRVLAERVFADPGARHALERILHPSIRAQWLPMAAAARASNRWHCFEIPLLYEAAVEDHFDRIIVVATSPALQRRRLQTQRNLSETMVTQIVAAQLDLSFKITRAHHLLWNESTPARLQEQTLLLAGWLQKRYGQHTL